VAQKSLPNPLYYSVHKHTLLNQTNCMYKENIFFLCSVPLSAEGPNDVTVVNKAKNSTEFPELFDTYEDKRRHAFNDDGIYSVVRADDILIIVRQQTPDDAKEAAWEESAADLITNLQHKVMQDKDKNAQSILKSVHDVEMEVKK